MAYMFGGETRGEVSEGRCRLALRSLAVDYPGGASLADLGKKKKVEGGPPPRADS